MTDRINRRQLIAGTAVVGTGAIAVAGHQNCCCPFDSTVPPPKVMADGWNTISPQQDYVNMLQSSDMRYAGLTLNQLQAWYDRVNTPANVVAEIHAYYLNNVVQFGFAFSYRTNGMGNRDRYRMGFTGIARRGPWYRRPRVRQMSQRFYEEFSAVQDGSGTGGVNAKWFVPNSPGGACPRTSSSPTPSPATSTLLPLYAFIRAERQPKVRLVQRQPGGAGKYRVHLNVTS